MMGPIRRRRALAAKRDLERRFQIHEGLCLSDKQLAALRTPGKPEFRDSLAAGIWMSEQLPMPVFMAIYYQRVKAARGVY